MASSGFPCADHEPSMSSLLSASGPMTAIVPTSLDNGRSAPLFLSTTIDFCAMRRTASTCSFANRTAFSRCSSVYGRSHKPRSNSALPDRVTVAELTHSMRCWSHRLRGRANDTMLLGKGRSDRD